MGQFAGSGPFDYPREVLTRIAGTPIIKLAELMPWRWTPAHPGEIPTQT